MKKDLFDLGIEGKIFIISGASGDIGLAIAKKLKKYGGIVHGCDLKSPKEISYFDTFKVFDATNIDFVKEFVESKVNVGLDCVICCAGIAGEVVDAEDVTTELFQTTINVSLLSSALFVKFATPYFKKSRKGEFILFSSTAGVRGTSLMPAYSAAKHGIIGLTRSYARELGPWGIRVNALLPGLIDSEMAISIHSSLQARVSSNIPQNKLPTDASAHIPLKRIGTSKDVAHAVLFLTSSMADYISCCMLNVDGGVLSK